MNVPSDITAVVRNALDEDLGDGDVTALLIDATTKSSAKVVCRESAVLCGAAWFEKAFMLLDNSCSVTWLLHDGDRLQPDDIVCELRGSARALVSGERTALNFLQTLSGTASVTSRYVEATKGTSVKLLDTRKTIPGLRSAQKYAVRCGGGRNHRIGLFDGILIKENHIEAAGSITQAITQMRSLKRELALEIEVESIAQAEEAISAGADILLLDNFSNDELRNAVQLARGKVKLEASGGFEFDDVSALAATGVDFISIGALTKHLRAVDYSMRFDAR